MFTNEIESEVIALLIQFPFFLVFYLVAIEFRIRIRILNRVGSGQKTLIYNSVTKIELFFQKLTTKILIKHVNHVRKLDSGSLDAAQWYPDPGYFTLIRDNLTLIVFGGEGGGGCKNTI